jgi:hypothetical protein
MLNSWSFRTVCLIFAWPGGMTNFNRLSYAKDTCESGVLSQHGRPDARLADRCVEGGRSSADLPRDSKRCESRAQGAGPCDEVYHGGRHFACDPARLVGSFDARSSHILDAVAKAGAGFRSLADIWADTTTPHGRLMLTVLGGLAEFERELIRTRTGEGRARAATRGVHMGRPPKLTAHQKREALNALADGSVSQADLARRFNVSQATISRLLR